MNYKLKAHQKFYLAIKRLIDILGSLIGILVLSLPILVFAIITATTSKGPVFFAQKRLGRHKKEFLMLKFRSMRVDSDPNAIPSDLTVEQQQSMITPWGKFMRKTSIDEIPQLFNIFVGQMSFIGPRPGQTEAYEQKLVQARESFTPNAYEVKPGISGLAQISMHRDHDPYHKAEYDSEYVKHLSFWMDLKIFVWSFLILLGVNRKDRGR